MNKERNESTEQDEEPIRKELEEFIEQLNKKEEVVVVEVEESEFRGHIEEQRNDFERDYLKAQMGILGADAVIRKIDFAQSIGKRIRFFKNEWDDPITGKEMVQYGCEFEDKKKPGFNYPDEREKK